MGIKYRVSKLLFNYIDSQPLEKQAQCYHSLYRRNYVTLLLKLFGNSKKSKNGQLTNIFSDYSNKEIVIYKEQEVFDALKEFDVISFDLFDTVLFRDVSAPTDIFLLMEKKYSDQNFAERRIQCEAKARNEKLNTTDTSEITQLEIYQNMFPDNVSLQKLWIQRELEMEKSHIFLNPIMKQLILDLEKDKKHLIAVSDMYLSEKQIEELLTSLDLKIFNDKIYVSSEYGFGKHDGKLFDIVLQKEKIKGKKIVHIGDNFKSDVINFPDKNFHYIHSGS